MCVLLFDVVVAFIVAQRQGEVKTKKKETESLVFSDLFFFKVVNMFFLYESDLDEEKKYPYSISDNDNILDPLDFGTLIMEMKCNYPKEKINKELVFKQFMTNLSIRIEDAKYLLELCMENILKECKE